MNAVVGTALPPDPLSTKVEALEALLREIAARHAPASLASSLSIEDMVLTDAILRLRQDEGVELEIFTLDTGRLHGDTLSLVDRVRKRYGYSIRIYRPDSGAVAAYVALHGRDGFYGSIAARKRCCEIRKLEPLQRALVGNRSWIVGMRREQSVTRTAIEVRSIDAVHGLEKFSPLAEWSEQHVWEYLRSYEVPYNPLYDQGYRSVGCAPCTRPVLPGEDVRAGRWWWEEPGSRECGLHVAPDGTLRRTRVPDPTPS